MNNDFPEKSITHDKEEKIGEISLELPNDHGQQIKKNMDDIDLNNDESSKGTDEVLGESKEIISDIDQAPIPTNLESSEISLDCVHNEAKGTPTIHDDQTEEQYLDSTEDADDSSSEISSNSESLTHFNVDLLLQNSKKDLVNIIQEVFQKRLLLEDDISGCKDELEQKKLEHLSITAAIEKESAQAKADAYAWENELKMTKEKLTQKNITIRTELASRLERVMKQCESFNRDKESMVIKYATAEKEVLVVKKQKENVEKKVKDLDRDKEILQGKIKTVTAERTRICNTLDNKIQECGLATRSIEKLKEEINAKDIKIKWGQTNLKGEIDAHKETQGKLDRALAKICNHDEEIESTKGEAEKIVRETKEGENTRANTLDKQLRETKALLILETQKSNDIIVLYKRLKIEHEALRSTHILLDTEATTMRVKVSKHDQEREESKRLFESLQSELKNVKQGADDLTNKLSHSAVYAQQLEGEKKKSESTEHQMKELVELYEEQCLEMSKCREKEAELLAFTQKLTDKDVTLRNQLTESQGKVLLLEYDHNEMKTQVRGLKAQVAELTTMLAQLEESKKKEEDRLSSLLEESTTEAADLRTKVSDLLNEIQVQHKKKSNSLKDSNREIQKLRRKIEALENSSSPKLTPSTPCEGGLETRVRNGAPNPSHWSQQESLSQESRASSDASLNTFDSSHTNGNSTIQNAKEGNGPSPVTELPQQVLIDRILKLQKGAIKKAEKMEFLEEHVSQLVGELKKKNKIIHHYIMKEDAGALSNSKSDDAKAEIMKHGGIMASVYGSSPKDGTMTLDLSLEINKKLQAVLEDTLLKNITLKDNLNTLGDEVAKLAHQNSHSLKSS